MLFAGSDTSLVMVRTCNTTNQPVQYADSDAETTTGFLHFLEPELTLPKAHWVRALWRESCTRFSRTGVPDSALPGTGAGAETEDYVRITIPPIPIWANLWIMSATDISIPWASPISILMLCGSRISTLVGP